VSYPKDFSSATYRLRPEAKWHDGMPVTVEDVIFSLQALKKYSPTYSAYYLHVAKVEKTGEREVTSPSDGPAIASCPRSSAEIYSCRTLVGGTDKNGNKPRHRRRPRGAAARSRAYRIKDFVPGRSISYERVKDYWGPKRQLNIGPIISTRPLRYFRDSTCARGVQGDQSTGGPRTAQILGHIVRFPRIQGQARAARGVCGPQHGHHAGVRAQQPA